MSTIPHKGSVTDNSGINVWQNQPGSGLADAGSEAADFGDRLLAQQFSPELPAGAWRHRWTYRGAR